MQWPKVSVITACYNSKEYIEETIQSVLNQTYPNIEYIIVDGASTDGTLDIINKYRDRVQWVISEKDQGVYDAFNKGVKAATGDIIQFLNSDDYYYNNDVIEEVATIFHGDKTVAMVYGNIRQFDDYDGFFCFRGKFTTLEHLKQGHMLPHNTLFARMDLFKSLGLFCLDYKIAADFDFVIRCFKEYEMSARYLDKTLVNFRLNGLSSNPLNQINTDLEISSIITKHFGGESFSAKTPESELEVVGKYYKLWLEMNLLHQKGITNSLHKLNIHKVAIFGTMKASLYMYEDLKKEGFEVALFLDNNSRMQNLKIRDVSVQSPLYLETNKVDAIIITIEKMNDKAVKEQLQQITGGNIPIYSWRQLIDMEYMNRRSWLTPEREEK